MIPVVLLVAATILQLTISPPLMTVLGIPYDAPTGSFVFKLHPATYLMLAAFTAAHLARGNPLRTVLQTFRQARLLLLYTAIMTMMLVYVVARYGFSGSAFIIETLITPAIGAALLQIVDRRVHRFLVVLIVFFMTVNALIGIGESIVQQRLIPHTVAGGVVLKEDVFRSTALLGHPLTNALVTGTTMIVVLGLPWRLPLKLGLLMILLLGLLSFGGRTGLALATTAALGLLGFRAVRGLVRAQFRYTQITGGLVLACLSVAGAIGFVAATGLGERIFQHMVWDHSAGVRVMSWQALGFMSRSELLFGISQLRIQEITYRLGLLYPLETIENFWLVMLMQLGAVGFVWFVTGIVAAGVHLCRGNSRTAVLAYLVFIAVASSNNSLASKTAALSIVFTLLTCTKALVTRGQPIPASRPESPATFAPPGRLGWQG